MDYTRAPLLFRLRKAVRYLRLFGLQRTRVKIAGQYHMRRQYTTLPPNDRPPARGAHVGIIGCGNYAFSVIAYFLRRNYGSVIRGCMDTDINRAASLATSYGAAWYSTNADRIINDPDIDLVFVASNHASHAEYACQALAAGKDVHIEKPHVVSFEQLERLCAAAIASPGRVLSLGYNRPRSVLGERIRDTLWAEEGAVMQSWFVSGHEIAADHWYNDPGEGGRILGNVCHWLDMTFQMMPPERRFPIRINPTRSVKPDGDISVSVTFGDGSIGVISFFSPTQHAFEGVKERYTAQRGNAIIAMDDFQHLLIDVGPRKSRVRLSVRDHGHEESIRRSYSLSRQTGSPGCSPAEIRDSGNLFLSTRAALEANEVVTIQAAR